MNTSPSDHLRFLVTQEAHAIARDGLPETCATEPSVDVHELRRRLQTPANDQLHHVLIIGWQAGAVEMLASDSVLSAKKIAWAVRPEHLGFLARDLAGDHGRRLSVHVCTCSDQAQLPAIMEHLPRHWTMALLDPVLCPPGDLHLLGQTRFQRTRNSTIRTITDLQHLLAREDRISQSIPIAAWKGRYAGRTALCLAAGPSLDRRLDFIKRHQERCVVIAVDVLQARLQEEGIKVDFIVNVDSHDIVARKFTRQRDPHTTMVMHLRGHRDLDQHFDQVSYFEGGQLGPLLIGKPCAFNTGTSVGIASVGFAHHLGCSEVVLLGHDLSWSTESYYSSMVTHLDSHTEHALEKGRKMQRRVPGNGDERVITDYLFEVAIQDMGMLLSNLQGSITAYNPNINDGTGARILATQPLPDGWQPRLAEEPCPRPQSAERADAPMERFTDIGELVAHAVEHCRDRWLALRERGISSALIEKQITTDKFGVLGYNFLRPFIEGILIHITTIKSLPPSIATSDHERESEALLAQALDAACSLIADICHGADFDAEATEPDAERVERIRQVVRLINLSRMSHAGDMLTTVYTPAKAASMREFCAVLPEVGIPTPLSAADGMELIRRIGGRLDDTYLSQTLCLAALEGLDELMDSARTSKVLPAALIPDAHEQRRKPGSHPWLDATEALLRVRDGSTHSAMADLKLACRWHPCRAHIMRCLDDNRPAVTDAVRRLVKSKELPLDDQSMALLMLHMPDFPLACHLVHPYTDEIGEATVLAVCQRQLQIGEVEKAITTLRNTRPLSRFHDQALHLLATVCMHRELWDEAAGYARHISNGELRMQWEIKHACATGTQHQLIEGFRDQGRVLHPSLLATFVEELIGHSQIDSLAALFCYILEVAPKFGQLRSQAIELTKSIQTVLRNAGVDVRALKHEVQHGHEFEIQVGD